MSDIIFKNLNTNANLILKDDLVIVLKNTDTNFKVVYVKQSDKTLYGNVPDFECYCELNYNEISTCEVWEELKKGKKEYKKIIKFLYSKNISIVDCF
jgi:hypothetical protein